MKIFKLLSLSLVLCMTLVGCGDSDDGDTNITVQEAPEIQREEGPVDSGTPVRVNVNVNNRVNIRNRTMVVENDDLVIDCDVEEGQQVVHQQVIYVAPSCSAIQNADVDNNGRVDRLEIEGKFGAPVATLESRTGPHFNVNQRIPLRQLPPMEENFTFVVYSEESAGVLIPIICLPFQVQIVSGDTETE